ncbi:MAG TPA: ABC transporter substrate-binding protein [Xanthobacteraceae bacterium]|nr:ABC transporter substrate-binding protein [Xanthobacteraceae bacterium]
MSGMMRRKFITLIGGAAAWPLAARAQQKPPMRRIGVLMNFGEDDNEGQRRVTLFKQILQQAGWSEGGNVQFEMRWAAGGYENYRRFATELVALRPDVILAVTTTAVKQLQEASRMVPIVFTGVIDPVGSGLITALSHPGGNATGFVTFEYALAAKWLELLKEIAPQVTRAAVLRNPTIAAGIGQFAAIQTVGAVGIELNALDFSDIDQPEWRIDRYGKFVRSEPPSCHRHACASVQATFGISVPLFRQRRWVDVLWP